MAERQFGPYRLVRQIAVGGMAEIHLAKTKGIAGFEKYVALKMIHPNFAEDEQFIQMLVDEAKIAVQLTHGNIAQTFDLGRVGDTYYITMEFVDGADLYKILRRASEQDYEMPLDVCAFIAKEITSALDHAHRKRDNFGKPLGIVHRDVSPQNVLISYSGEIKLVDFGIAKATMKARQTAVGVIKGKYYYMSPEQAWGDPIDYRSDIFSAGIVLYEMITGQMLYLEEDLHKLLDMARKADIAPPSKLRRGVPPQLERIVMHALAKMPGERYQSAGDFATDLERFLHAYSPVFTAGKISTLIRKVIGDPAELAVDPQGFPSVEIRDGAMSTMQISDSELAHAEDKDDLRDENSVIFRVAELRPQTQTKKPPEPRPTKPRQIHEETRQLGSAPPGPNDEGSGLLAVAPPKPTRAVWDSTATIPGEDELENVGERTIITGAPGGGGGGFMMDVAGEDGVDATMVTSAPSPFDSDTDGGGLPDTRDDALDDAGDDDEGPTLAREAFARPAPRTPAKGARAQPPPALAAKIHAPAVSALRQPKASRRTPPGGVPAQANVLQQIVGSQASEPMPAPRQDPPAFRPQPPSQPPPQQFPSATPGGMSYAHDASGLPIGLPTPPSGVPAPGQHVPPHMQPYMQVQGMPPQPPQGYPVQPQYPGMTPGALYQMHSPYPVQPMTLTGQMRLFEVDELPAAYRLGAARRRWFTYITAGVIAISVAAIATYLIIRVLREGPQGDATTGTIAVNSVPENADVYLDDDQAPRGKTNRTIDAPPGAHTVRLKLAHYRAEPQQIVVREGSQTTVNVTLDLVPGKIIVDSKPEGAEIRVDGQLKGVTPKTVPDLDTRAAKKLELRLKGYQPYVMDLAWPEDDKATITVSAQLKP